MHPCSKSAVFQHHSSRPNDRDSLRQISNARHIKDSGLFSFPLPWLRAETGPAPLHRGRGSAAVVAVSVPHALTTRVHSSGVRSVSASSSVIIIPPPSLRGRTRTDRPSPLHGRPIIISRLTPTPPHITRWSPGLLHPIR